MKATTIGVYDTEKQVLDVIKKLKEHHFSNKEISVIWHKKDTHEEAQEQEKKITVTAAAEVGAGLTIGGALGALTGLGIIAIPGLGFLFGAGALVGIVAGVDFGVIAGTIIGALSIPGIKKHHEEKYDAELKAGKHLLLV
ncbi:MAG: general stress protein [Chitinophagales bacterium]|nr:general stress protein [Chitinophagales bacterium]MBP8752601.1 general stress protein [Chitinophagales bacterium]MBP9547840.1 general stress protein [Chitinophagales bacterium]MBP9703413.1 general stress protein [Chitinophagales bacterium]